MNNNEQLKWLQGCDNQIPSPTTLNGEPLKSFDKNKIIKILKTMPQREIDASFTAIADLLHHEASTLGLWAVDKTPEQLINLIEEDNTDYKKVITEYMFHLK